VFLDVFFRYQYIYYQEEVMKKRGIIIPAAVLAVAAIIYAACTPAAPVIDMNGWTVETGAGRDSLTLRHADLDIVLRDVQFWSDAAGAPAMLSDWKIETADNVYTVTTSAGTINLTADDLVLNISASVPDITFRAEAPANEDRIPARTEDQDNGVMMTSLGTVSGAMIHKLFDRMENIMIAFPAGTRMIPSEDGSPFLEVSFPLEEDGTVSLTPDYYINELKLKYYQPKPERFRNAAAAWSSWYCYYMGTTEADMVKETDTLAKYLKPYGLEYVQLDACYTRGEEANYLEWNKEAFPQGGKWLFEYIRSQGLKPALWVNIYGSNYAKPEMADSYPENFFLRDLEGNLSGACCTADETVVRLDYTNPAVIEQHLKPMFRTLKQEWGLTYLKDAGWGTWMDYYEKNKENAFDPSMDSRTAYLAAQKALRETVGPDVYIGGCAMHEVGLGFGIFDGSRIGGDDRAVWYPNEKSRMSMQTYFHSLFGANYLNNIVWHCDPDAAMVRNPLTYDEGRTVVTAIGLTGQLYMASDFMHRLSEQKLELYQKTMPTTHIVPVDLYPYKIESNKRDGVVWSRPRVKEYPRVIDLKVNGLTGMYDVAALFNWEDQPAVKSLSFYEDLGLAPDTEYVLFDFWEQQLRGVHQDSFSMEIPTHGTAALVIRPLYERPQFLATSRHITGTVSVKEFYWNESSMSFQGVSELVSGDDYAIFFHVPEGFEVSKVEADTEVLFQRLDSGLLEVRLSGDLTEDNHERVSWQVSFREAS
jgi:hypothetical protein